MRSTHSVKVRVPRTEEASLLTKDRQWLVLLAAGELHAPSQEFAC